MLWLKATSCWVFNCLYIVAVNNFLLTTNSRFYFSFHYFFCSNVNSISKSIIFYNIQVNSFAPTLLALYLFVTHPWFFFIFYQVVGKPFKFIKCSPNKWKISEWIELPQFCLSLCIYSGSSLGKISKEFLYRYHKTSQNIQTSGQ